MNYNKIIFGGNITSEPIIKSVSGNNVANFSIASNHNRKKNDGTLIQEVCFLEVEAWGSKADVAAKFLKRGDQVMVEGRLKQNSWEDDKGVKRYRFVILCEDIILLGSKDADLKSSKVKTISDSKEIVIKNTNGSISGDDYLPF